MLEITGLHPFAHYEFILRAATSSGEGNTTEASEITDEAGNELLWLGTKSSIYLIMSERLFVL